MISDSTPLSRPRIDAIPLRSSPTASFVPSLRVSFPLTLPLVLRPGRERNSHCKHTRVLFRLPLLVPRTGPAAASALTSLYHAAPYAHFQPSNFVRSLHPRPLLRQCYDLHCCLFHTHTRNTHTPTCSHPCNPLAPVRELHHHLVYLQSNPNIQCSTALLLRIHLSSRSQVHGPLYLFSSFRLLSACLHDTTEWSTVAP
jgi:hypothetical protein